MPISSLVTVSAGVRQVFLPLAPVPAARPRVSKWGTYYPKTYAKWRKDAAEMLAPHADKFEPWSCPVYVQVNSGVKRPAKPTRPIPHPDVDNFAKAALDAIQKCGFLIEDDKQVQVLLTAKRFVSRNEPPHTTVYIGKSLEILTDALYFPDVKPGEDVYDLPDSFRCPFDTAEEE